MESGLILTFFLMVLGQSCTNSIDEEGFITLKPGHFCKVGSIKVVNGCIYIGGSFIKLDNPNASIPARQSYIASIDTGGNINWEMADDKPDYTQWNKLIIDGENNLHALGTVSSPFKNKVATYLHFNILSPKDDEQVWLEGTKQYGYLDAYQTKSGNLAFIYYTAGASANQNCLNKQVVQNALPNTLNTSFCVTGTISTAYCTSDSQFIAAWGQPLVTHELCLVNDTGLQRKIAIPDAHAGLLVNDITAAAPNNYLLATTTKNGQGPCVYKMDELDSIKLQVCLNHWSLHGSTHIKSVGECTLIAYNATDSINGNAVHIAIINKLNTLIFEETVLTSQKFVLSDLAVYQSKVYLAGTLETESEGSSIAIKTIPIPPNTSCEITE